jgi:tRNA-dihydrouridine synthase A
MYQRRFLTQSPCLLNNRGNAVTADGDAEASTPPPPPPSFLTDTNEGSSILQLGGSSPEMLASAVTIILTSQHKYGEWTGINLNCGCPSDKVSLKGAFGAVLMKDPQLVGECIAAMIKAEQDYRAANPSAPRVEISVKCRIGVDDADRYADMKNFVETVHSVSGCRVFYVHARRAVLDGTFSPLDNRTIPPLMYDYVYRLKKERPDLEIHLNGGVNSVKEIIDVVKASEVAEGRLDGVMVGRGLVSQPWYFSSMDRVLYGDGRDNAIRTRRDLIVAYGRHADLEEEYEGSKRGRRRILRPIVNLFNGESHAKRWRQEIDKLMNSAGSKRKGFDKKELLEDEKKLSELVYDALAVMDPEVVDRTREESYEMLLLQDEVCEAAIASGNTLVSKESVAREAIKLWDLERKKMREMEGGEALFVEETEEDIINKAKEKEEFERRKAEWKLSKMKV